MITVGLVGATNAGKSTLFNRLIGTYRAIVTDIEGTTQDILKHEFELNGQKVTLLDTPGLHDFSDELEMIGRVIKQSGVIVFVVNHQTGWTHKDTDIATMIRKAGREKETILLVNKVDRAHNDTNTMLIKADYYQYGFENVVLTSTMHGRGLDELQDSLDDFISFNENEVNEPGTINLAIVGKPNTGKSTLMNTLCKGQISKVSEVAGTTLDYLMHDFKWGEDVYTLFDTSGIRRKGRARGLEKIANDKTFSMLEFIKPMVIFTVDASEPVSQTDLALFNRLIELHLPIVVALTKIDKISKEELDRLIKGFQNGLYQSKWIDYVGISSFTKAGLGPLMKKIRAIHERAQNRVSTAQLNKILTTAWITNPPNFPKNRICKIYYGTQTDVNPPTFNLFINNNDKITNSFTRWIENVLRQHLDMQGLPIKIYYKGKDRGKDRD